MFIVLLFVLSIIGSIISQLPSFVQEGGGDLLKVVWVLPFTFMLFKKPKEYLHNSLSMFFALFFVFGGYCIAMEAVTGTPYIGSDIRNILISCLITVVSYKFWLNYGSAKTVSLISLVTLITCVVLAYIINRDFLSQVDVQEHYYAYSSKNSVSSILFCSVILSLFVFFSKFKWKKILIFVFVAYLIYIIMILKSRATIAGFAFVLYYFIFKSHNKRVIYLSILLTIIGILLILSTPSLYQTIVEGIVLAGRDADDLNDVSSGRIYLINEGLVMLFDGFWFGQGNMYLDCMPLVMLLQYGVFGASIIFIFLFSLAKKVSSLTKTNDINIVTFLLFYCYIINSIFEAQPPFGPGVKCFILWMMIGFSFAEIKRHHMLLKKEGSLYDDFAKNRIKGLQ